MRNKLIDSMVREELEIEILLEIEDNEYEIKTDKKHIIYNKPANLLMSLIEKQKNNK